MPNLTQTTDELAKEVLATTLAIVSTKGSNGLDCEDFLMKLPNMEARLMLTIAIRSLVEADLLVMRDGTLFLSKQVKDKLAGPRKPEPNGQPATE